MRMGVIGTGNMGVILTEALIEAGTFAPSNVTVTNRTLAKAFNLQKWHPGMQVADCTEKLVKASDILFICVKPAEFHSVVEDMVHHIIPSQCVVSITSPISVKQLEHILPCSCARFIPSITNRALSGISLLTFGEGCAPHWKQHITGFASSISNPVEINNEITRVASDIVSCGPAFFSFIARAFIDGACHATVIDEKTATILTEKMLIGLGDLLRKEIFTLPALQEKVCVKGGITGEGIKVLEAGLGDVFYQLFLATQEKFAEDLEKIEGQFGTSY
ncbi:late competence protein ComER [Peribacillus sp. SCS-155]|uniref:late competence protein ComER n=1 Tax=Peribacillus sedimenti TaxID=3115297 RepID=UPI003906773E